MNNDLTPTMDQSVQSLASKRSGNTWETPAEQAYANTKEGKAEAKQKAYEKTDEGKAAKAKEDAEKEKKHP